MLITLNSNKPSIKRHSWELNKNKNVRLDLESKLSLDLNILVYVFVNIARYLNEKNSKPCAGLIITFVLILAGDVETNPGPELPCSCITC